MTMEKNDLGQGRLRLGLAAQGALRWAAVDFGDVVEIQRQRRDLSPVSAVALGQMLSAAALLHRLQFKTPVRLILEARGDGPLERVTAEADKLGHVRGTVGHPQAVLEGEAGQDLDVGKALGKGLLKVRRQMAETTYESQVSLVEKGSLSRQLAFYLEQSEQTPSAVLLGVLTRPEGVASAGGMILEALPGTDPDLLEALEVKLQDLNGISRTLEGSGLDGLQEAVLGELDQEVLEERLLDYACGCERERFRWHIANLPREDRGYLVELDPLEPGGDRAQEAVDVECNFCGTHYSFSPEELSLLQ